MVCSCVIPPKCVSFRNNNVPRFWESPDHLRNHVNNVDKHHKELSQICLHAAVSDTPLSDCLTSLDQTYGNFNEQRQLNFLKDSKKINSPYLLAQSASMTDADNAKVVSSIITRTNIYFK